MRSVSAVLNRTALTLLGVGTLLLGAALVAVSTGVAARVSWVRTWVATPEERVGKVVGPVAHQLPLVAGVVAALCLLLALWWLARQIPTRPRRSTYGLADDIDAGAVTTTPDVVARPVREHLESLTGVAQARVNLSGSAKKPVAVVRLVVSPRTPLPLLLDQVYGDVLADLELALESPLEHVALEIDAEREGARSRTTSVRGD